jgi:hypothetical protein
MYGRFEQSLAITLKKVLFQISFFAADIPSHCRCFCLNSNSRNPATSDSVGDKLACVE